MAGGVIKLYQDERKEFSFELKDLDNRLPPRRNTGEKWYL